MERNESNTTVHNVDRRINELTATLTQITKNIEQLDKEIEDLTKKKIIKTLQRMNY